MNHHTTTDFWDCYNRLPESVRAVADANYALLKANPRHPSLHFKRVGKLWSVRVGIGYRALATDCDDGPVWFWIGSHAEYDRLIRGA
jgi:hypothetical protein